MTSRQARTINPVFTVLSIIAFFQLKPNDFKRKSWSATIISQQMLNMTLNLTTDKGEDAMLKLIAIIDASLNVRCLVLFYAQYQCTYRHLLFLQYVNKVRHHRSFHQHDIAH